MIDAHRYRPLYSADNEDTRSELTALEIGRDDTVITIAAGGGRALSLLTAAPKRLLAIDRQPDQIYNLELKAAARWRERDLSGLKAFLSATPHCKAGILCHNGDAIAQLGPKLWALPTGLVLM